MHNTHITDDYSSRFSILYLECGGSNVISSVLAPKKRKVENNFTVDSSNPAIRPSPKYRQNLLVLSPFILTRLVEKEKGRICI